MADTSFDPEVLERELRKQRQRANYLLALRRAERAAHFKGLLLNALGHKCAICGSSFDLEIDHVDGRNWEPRRITYDARYLRYIIEYISGVKLRTLCAHHNGKLGGAIGNARRRHKRRRASSR